MSSTRCTTTPGTPDHDADPNAELGSDEPEPAADWTAGLADDGLDTDAIDDESETSGATTGGSAPTAISRRTADGPSTARWSGLDRIADSPEEPSPVEPGPATGGLAGGIGEAITVDAIGEESDTNGATSIGSLSLST